MKDFFEVCFGVCCWVAMILGTIYGIYYLSSVAPFLAGIATTIVIGILIICFIYLSFALAHLR